MGNSFNMSVRGLLYIHFYHEPLLHRGGCADTRHLTSVAKVDLPELMIFERIFVEFVYELSPRLQIKIKEKKWTLSRYERLGKKTRRVAEVTTIRPRH